MQLQSWDHGEEARLWGVTVNDGLDSYLHAFLLYSSHQLHVVNKQLKLVILLLFT